MGRGVLAGVVSQIYSIEWQPYFHGDCFEEVLTGGIF